MSSASREDKSTLSLLSRASSVQARGPILGRVDYGLSL